MTAIVEFLWTALQTILGLGLLFGLVIIGWQAMAHKANRGRRW